MDQTKTNGNKKKSSEAKVKKEEKTKASPAEVKNEPRLVIKRDWAKKAEDDDDAVYDGFRKYKGFDSIANITDWTRQNVLNFEEGKMFETLMGYDGLFDNHGLEQHDGSVGYLRDVVNNKGIIRKSNSKEFGFMMVTRSIVKDVFKEKCRGLVLKNLQVRDNAGKAREMRVQFGKFLDEVIRQAEKKDGNFGRKFLDIDRFKLETIKNNLLPYTTGDKTGTYEIQDSFDPPLLCYHLTIRRLIILIIILIVILNII